MSKISGPYLCFQCSKSKEIIIAVHRLYRDKQEARKRITKVKKLGYENVTATDLGEDGIRIQELWCHDCILRF